MRSSKHRNNCMAGQRKIDECPESSEVFFPMWAATQVNSGNAMDLLDKKLMGNANAEQVNRAAIAEGWCIEDDEDAMPSKSQVVQILEGIVDVPPLLQPNSFILGNRFFCT